MRPTGIIDTENHRIERTNYKNVEFTSSLKTRNWLHSAIGKAPDS